MPATRSTRLESLPDLLSSKLYAHGTATVNMFVVSKTLGEEFVLMPPFHEGSFSLQILINAGKISD